MSGTQPEQKSTPVQLVQALRAFAAITVLIGHVILEAGTRFHFDDAGLMRLPWLSGVDIFFVISGFIMVVTSWDRFGRPGAQISFLRHRLLRIAPLYWLFTTLMVGVVLLTPGVLGATKLDFGQIFTSYLFIPYMRGDGEIQPVLSPGWTLNYEMLFYAIFAVCLSFPRKAGIIVIAAVLTGLCLVHPFAPNFRALWFWSDNIILEFAFGIGVGCLYSRGVRHLASGRVATAAIAAAFALFILKSYFYAAVGLHLPRCLASGLPATLVLAALVLLPPQKMDAATPTWLLRLGDGSYSLYLSHRFGLRISTIVFGKLIHFASLWGILAFITGTVLVCIALGQLVFYQVERRLLRFTRRRLHVGVFASHQVN